MSSPRPALVPAPAVGPDDLRLSRLEALLDPVFLSEAGWDAERALLQPPPDHRLLGWAHCSVPGCTVETSNQLCTGCRNRQAASGLSPEQFIASSPTKKHGGAEGRWLFDERLCHVDGCQRPMHARTVGLCNSHALRCRDVFGRLDPIDVPLFLERSDTRPFPSWGPWRPASGWPTTAPACVCFTRSAGTRRCAAMSTRIWLSGAAARTASPFPVSRTSAACHEWLCLSFSAACSCVPARAERSGLLKRIGSHEPRGTNRSRACAISTWRGSAEM